MSAEKQHSDSPNQRSGNVGSFAGRDEVDPHTPITFWTSTMSSVTLSRCPRVPTTNRPPGSRPTFKPCLYFPCPWLRQSSAIPTLTRCLATRDFDPQWDPHGHWKDKNIGADGHIQRGLVGGWISTPARRILQNQLVRFTSNRHQFNKWTDWSRQSPPHFAPFL